MPIKMRWLLTVFIALACSGLLVYKSELAQPFIYDFCLRLASATFLLLHAFNPAIQRHETLISQLGESFSLSVDIDCSGLTFLWLFWAALLAFNVSWPYRIAGIVVGSVLIQSSNVLRLSSLMWIGPRLDRPVFDFIHEMLWTLLLDVYLLALIVVWLYCCGVFTHRPLRVLLRFSLRVGLATLLGILSWRIMLEPVLMPLFSMFDNMLLHTVFPKIQANLTETGSEWSIDTRVLTPEQAPGKIMIQAIYIGSIAKYTLSLPLVWLLIASIPYRRWRNIALATVLQMLAITLTLWLLLVMDVINTFSEAKTYYVLIEQNIRLPLFAFPAGLVLFTDRLFGIVAAFTGIVIPTLLAFYLNRPWWSEKLKHH